MQNAAILAVLFLAGTQFGAVEHSRRGPPYRTHEQIQRNFNNFVWDELTWSQVTRVNQHDHDHKGPSEPYEVSVEVAVFGESAVLDWLRGTEPTCFALVDDHSRVMAIGLIYTLPDKTQAIIFVRKCRVEE